MKYKITDALGNSITHEFEDFEQACDYTLGLCRTKPGMPHRINNFEIIYIPPGHKYRVYQAKVRQHVAEFDHFSEAHAFCTRHIDLAGRQNKMLRLCISLRYKKNTILEFRT